MKLLAKLSLPRATQTSWQSMLENALLVAAGAAVTYVTQNISNVDFGTFTPIIVSIASIALNFIKNLIDAQVTPDPGPNPTPTPTPTPTPSTDEGRDFPLI
jgi:hypothetical protein